MEVQQALVSARIADLRQSATDVKDAGVHKAHREPGALARVRLSVGLWLVDLGMALVHGPATRQASIERR